MPTGADHQSANTCAMIDGGNLLAAMQAWPPLS
jgi:hypothetical protein